MSDHRTPSTPSPSDIPASLETAGATMIEATLIEPGPDTSVRPFEFHASDEDLADLRRRILATRWPEQETVADDTQGVQLATAQKLAHY